MAARKGHAGVAVDAKRGRNLFLISTPIQLFFASAVAQQLGIRAEYLLATDYGPSLVQLEDLTRLLALDNVRRLVRPRYGSGDRVRQFICESLRWQSMVRLTRELQPGDRVFLGFINFATNRPLFSGSGYDLAFFDEGVATIGLLVRRSQGKKEICFPPPRAMTWFTALYPRTVFIDRIRYYTVYPRLNGAPGDGISIIHPQLPDDMKRQRRQIPEIWYIGSPLVQAGLMSETRQREILSGLRDASLATGARLVHYKHRSEKYGSPCLGIEVREPELPFEVYFGLSDVRPMAIVSVVSSVIMHMELFFADECALFHIDPQTDFDTSRVEAIQGYAATALGIPRIGMGGLAAALESLRP